MSTFVSKFSNIRQSYRAVFVPLIAVVAFAFTIVGTSAAAFAAAPITLCDDNGLGYCLNRGGGCTNNQNSGCSIIAYTNDFDNNEYANYQNLNLCSGGDTVTTNCPFTVGTGLNDDNVGDQIVQIAMYNVSNGNAYGCVGDNGTRYTTLVGCNGGNGSGGGVGSIFVEGTGNQGKTADTIEFNGLASRAGSDDDGYIIGLDVTGLRQQLITNGRDGVSGGVGASSEFDTHVY
jgi:hypothetical protein